MCMFRFHFYPWFKFSFLLFQTDYHTLHYPKAKKKQNKTKRNRTSLPPLEYILCMRQFDPLLTITCFCFTANKCLNKAKVHPRMSIKSVSTLFGSPLFIIACKLAVHKQNYYFWELLVHNS